MLAIRRPLNPDSLKVADRLARSIDLPLVRVLSGSDKTKFSARASFRGDVPSN